MEGYGNPHKGGNPHKSMALAKKLRAASRRGALGAQFTAKTGGAMGQLSDAELIKLREASRTGGASPTRGALGAQFTAAEGRKLRKIRK